jgi:hypothetical protein
MTLLRLYHMYSGEEHITAIIFIKVFAVVCILFTTHSQRKLNALKL